jgi:hypothetical protein
MLDMPAYENDVLRALAQTGGLPAPDAYNQVVVFRGGLLNPGLWLGLEHLAPGANPMQLAPPSSEVICIPLRALPGAPPPAKPEDVLLHDGDVVFLEARDPEIFYTAGLLPPGQYVLPRDIDLSVVEAISLVKGPLVNAAFATSNLAGTLLEQGIGNPSPSLVTVLRRTPSGGQVPIRVDLNEALRDRRENILVQPGDVLVLQEKPSEALTRYLTRTLLDVSLTWQFLHDRFLTGVLDVSAPERIPARIGVGTTTTTTP